MTVNHDVAGSSPAGGAKKSRSRKCAGFLLCKKFRAYSENALLSDRICYNICHQTKFICVHGDNEHALEFVKLIRAKIKEDGIHIKPLGEVIG